MTDSTQYATWLRGQIDEHSPEAATDPHAAVELAKACAALGGASAQAFGMDVPAQFPGRDELKQLAIDALKRWLPKLDGDAKEKLKKLIGEYRLTGA